MARARCQIVSVMKMCEYEFRFRLFDGSTNPAKQEIYGNKARGGGVGKNTCNQYLHNLLNVSPSKPGKI